MSTPKTSTQTTAPVPPTSEPITAPGFPVAVTPQAVSQIKNLVARKGHARSFLRIGVKGGGCSGLEYLFMLDDQPRPGDLLLSHEDTTIACDPKSAKFLQGATLVFTGNLLGGGGFAFENPNAARSCGCGTSFTPK